MKPPKNPTPPSRPLPLVINDKDFLAAPLPLPPGLVESVFHQGGKMSMVGGSKSYKSWLAPDMALAIQHGVPWFGIPTTKARVFYLNFEVQAPFFQRRLEAIRKARNLPPPDGDMHIWNLRGHATPYDDLIPKVIEYAKKEQVAAAFTDPIYKLYGPETDENSAAQIAILMNKLDEVCESGTGIVFTAHSPKGNQAGKEAIDRSSGSGVFGRDPDSILTLTPHKEADCLVIEFKFRNYPPRNPFVIRWRYPVFEVEPSLNPADLRRPPNQRPKYDLTQLLEILRLMCPCLTSQLVAEYEAKLQMPRQTFHSKYRDKLAKMPGVLRKGDLWDYSATA